MRNPDGTSYPYIDLSNDSITDYDARIKLSSDDLIEIV
jgi:hypothetical protein